MQLATVRLLAETLPSCDPLESAGGLLSLNPVVTANACARWKRLKRYSTRRMGLVARREHRADPTESKSKVKHLAIEALLRRQPGLQASKQASLWRGHGSLRWPPFYSHLDARSELSAVINTACTNRL